MRKGEILALKWKNIDNKYIHILESKSGNSRKIPNSGQLKELLYNIPKDNEYVFYNHQSKTKYTDIKRQFNTAIKNANIDNFRFHDLRHTAATRMVNNGIDLVVVKEILGHADIKTTMRYAHSLEETKIKAINILNSY
ncbi:MAG: site-specific integrase [Candidatus Gastranaerophilales bacterium]|nr:site-specific integrase [Candidatus Gastranaerophilales bacterium]